MAIPCIGLIMTFVWAFVGENESRKNYFKALLIWYLILGIAALALFAWGFWPVIAENIQYWLNELIKRFVTKK
jgi:peptidoglycan/LPS O-acetylase OafA/YrhL